MGDEADDAWFLNVDLDLRTTEDPSRFVEAMAPAFPLHVEPSDGIYWATLELNLQCASADETIDGLVRLLRALPVEARRIWDDAVSRQFDIGIQAHAGQHAFELTLKPETVRAVADLGACIKVTVYGPR